jgi:hypothetical protein
LAAPWSKAVTQNGARIMESRASAAFAGEIAQARYDPGSVKDFQGETDRCQAADFFGT